MATTTASLTLESADLFEDSLSISNTTTLHKAGTTIGSEDETEYIIVGIGDAVIGRLYAGDFMWMPWSPKAQHVNDIEITPSVATGMFVEFMAIHNYANIYPNSADS